MIARWSRCTALVALIAALAGCYNPHYPDEPLPRPNAITIVAGNDQTAAAGTAVAIKPAVKVSDQFGDPFPNLAVTFAIASGGGTAGALATTDARGIATIAGWTLGAAGPNTLTASVPGFPNVGAVTFTATATP